MRANVSLGSQHFRNLQNAKELEIIKVAVKDSEVKKTRVCVRWYYMLGVRDTPRSKK